jgi:hypothetical protein
MHDEATTRRRDENTGAEHQRFRSLAARRPDGPALQE